MLSNGAGDFKTDLQKWRGVQSNDTAADGVFWYGVTSTGIVCKPSCRSRNPKRANVKFFDTLSLATEVGFRLCKRCRP